MRLSDPSAQPTYGYKRLLLHLAPELVPASLDGAAIGIETQPLELFLLLRKLDLRCHDGTGKGVSESGIRQLARSLTHSNRCPFSLHQGVLSLLLGGPGGE